jgi:hypothetical protein
MNLKVRNKLFIIISFILGVLLSGCSLNKASEETRALFSWKSSEVLEGRTELLKTMKELKLNTVYQSFSEDLLEEDISVFLEEANDKNIDVYLLEGDPEWALEKKAESMCLQVEKAINIKKLAGEDYKIKGILLDVEPYLLEQWEKKKQRKEIMDGFIENMKIAYEKARNNGLEVIACIPYYYDDWEFSNHVEALIVSGCDQLAVMNYYQGKEYEHIEKEAKLLEKYNKNLINIYEMQSPGKHGLIDKNTYYEEGIASVEENFIALKKALEDQQVSIALHDYEALKEVISHE